MAEGALRLDGWRIDVANMTGWIRDDNFNREIANTIRATMDEVSPETFLIGEFTSDAANHVEGDNYQSTMTYSNFTRPTWRWLWNPKEKKRRGPGWRWPQGNWCSRACSAPPKICRHLPLARSHAQPKCPGHPRHRQVQDLRDSRCSAGSSRHAVHLPGHPHDLSGDEFGLDGWNGESSRTPMPWNLERQRIRP